MQTLKVVYLGDSAALRELSEWGDRHGVQAVESSDDEAACAVVDQTAMSASTRALKRLRERHLPCLSVSRGWCFLASAVGRGLNPVV
ncbi:hypothetical protein [Amycolatopsis magusensis]|uniref:Uncharacterized protein n=1 Tax=Amycolatopsis magusensis TaxID=882444 RepID=A0ABS4PZG5_9PSEU|nr:hypothetical protein [Amycolatopsis magusensis]MBP2184818.1 hypothetical protein [Amycolatopsis magusensis]MDI5974876.1 hypothetical protein [Amycolatopsis magusensis]UJW29322.1 hypothetical protein L3Q67_29310 [Saccharothrix sp. AJ9571]